MQDIPIAVLLESAIAARAALFDSRHQTALRLFCGFSEGAATLVVDLYGGTVVLHNYADPPACGDTLAKAAQAYLQTCLPWVHTYILKAHHADTPRERQGLLLSGTGADQRIVENGVWYAIDLTMNRDASFYLDTRNLRLWAASHLRGKRVLNTFAYTGSLGVAACAGGASRVVHLDRTRSFLDVAKASYALNGLPVNEEDFLVGDFWAQVSRLKRSGARFDCVLVDPPVFAACRNGTVDLMNNSVGPINKVRPLIEDGGCLVAVNNALFLSGRAYVTALEAVCADGHLGIQALIPVPADSTGYPDTRVTSAPVDPAPFNHSTKIVELMVYHKSQPECRLAVASA